MSIERPPKRDRVPIPSIDTFARIEQDSLKDLEIPRESLKAMRYIMSASPKESIEILQRSQGDGMENYLVCGVTERKRCLGMMTDILGSQGVGETSFAGAIDRDSNEIIRVLTTFTETDLRGVGLAERRLITVNEYCTKRFGKVLSSSLTPSSDAIRLWDRLRERGLVEVNNEGGQERYAFIKKI